MISRVPSRLSRSARARAVTVPSIGGSFGRNILLERRCAWRRRCGMGVVRSPAERCSARAWQRDVQGCAHPVVGWCRSTARRTFPARVPGRRTTQRSSLVRWWSAAMHARTTFQRRFQVIDREGRRGFPPRVSPRSRPRRVRCRRGPVGTTSLRGRNGSAGSLPGPLSRSSTMPAMPPCCESRTHRSSPRAGALYWGHGQRQRCSRIVNCADLPRARGTSALSGRLAYQFRGGDPQHFDVARRRRSGRARQRHPPPPCTARRPSATGRGRPVRSCAGSGCGTIAPLRALS